MAVWKTLRLGAGAAVAAVFAASAFAGFSPGASAPTTSTASGGCSKAAALAAAKRVPFLAHDELTAVFQVLCGAFAGPGSKIMVASFYGPGSIGVIDWAVFRPLAGAWQLVLTRHEAVRLVAVGSDFQETMSVFRPGDSRCCPSGGTRSRLWHWNGSRFVASAWKTKLATLLHLETFLSPDRKVGCAVNSDQVWCATNPPGPGVHYADLHRNGDVRLCDATPNDICLQNAITRATVLHNGQRNELRGFRCTSGKNGVTCTVIAGEGKGKGFVINAAGAARVGP